MIGWYIDSSKTEQKYLNQVEKIVTPCMDYFCERLCEIEMYEIDDIKRIFNEIIEELPILTLLISNNGEFSFKYNSNTTIRFSNGVQGVIREIKLNKILN